MERKAVSHVLLVLLLLQQFRSVNTFYGLDMKCLNWKLLLIAATSVFLPGDISTEVKVVLYSIVLLIPCRYLHHSSTSDEDINSETTTVTPDDKPKPEELTVLPPTTTPKPGPISLKN
ncbi:uncharacterized protein LOC111114472 isoform X1 [Crassostrea virginica]